MNLWQWIKNLFKTKPTYPPAPEIVKANPVQPTPSVPVQPVAPTAASKVLPWMAIAEKEIGVKEIAGAKHHPKILEYHAATTLRSTTDEVAWCAAFVSWVFVKAGMKSQRSAWARDWLKWGIKLDRPIPGCVVVLARGTGGHVYFYKSGFGTGWIKGTGGNQSNQVNVASFAEANVLGYRWPSDYPLPS